MQALDESNNESCDHALRSKMTEIIDRDEEIKRHEEEKKRLKEGEDQFHFCIDITLPMLRLPSSKTQGRKEF